MDKIFIKAFLLLSSAVLLTLSFPKPALSYLAWIALIPLFLALENASARDRFRLGYLLGFGYSLGVFYWVTFSMRHYGHLNLPTSISILIAMALYLALYPGIFAWLWGFIPQNGFFSLIWGPSLWVGLEFVRGMVLTGFPWALLGYTQFERLPIIQISEFTGIYGISFLILFVNQALYQLFFSSGPWTIQTGKMRMALGVLLISVLGLVWLTGGYLQSRDKERSEKSDRLKVGIVQGNIDQSLKWNPDYQDETIDIYNDLTKRSVSILKNIGKPQEFKKESDLPLIVWPETAVPFYFLNENRHTPRLMGLARETGAYLLFGSPAFQQMREQRQYFNRAYLLSPEGHISYYDKTHLVPFGEYVPLKKMLPFVNRMVESIGDFSAGPGGYGLAHARTRVGVLICFETIFPELSRAFKRDGCEILVNLTNDAWFGRTSAPYQHLSMLVFRAVENRTWVARAANTGFSAVIDSEGRIRQKTSLFEKGAIQAIIPLRKEATFYSRYGDLWVGVCFLIILGGAIRVLGFKGRVSPPKSKKVVS